MSEDKRTRFQICVPVPQEFKEAVEKQMRRKAFEEDRKITYAIVLDEALSDYFGCRLVEDEKPKLKKKGVKNDK